MLKTVSRLITLLVFLPLFLFWPTGKYVSAQEFAVDAQVNYAFDTNGVAIVEHTITLENLFSNLYATSYTLTLNNVTAKNLQAFEADTKLTIEELPGTDKTDYKILFTDGVVGQGAVRQFNITFEVPDFANKTGEVWEVSIPKLGKAESFRNYSATVAIPQSFGNLAYVSPQFKSVNQNGDRNIYEFSKDDIANFGISLGFGQFQVFSYVLNYHLENPLAIAQEQSIPIPPDTSFQKVFIETVSPKPVRLEEDIDGNWLLFYALKPRQRLDIVVGGTVQIFAAPRFITKLTKEEKQALIAPTSFWQSDDTSITNLAVTLANPRAIYDYLVTTFDYDYERVKPNVKRLGALDALANPTNAICTEFTDTFIALARSKGIPAREINGFAYTENKDIQPLGLVADVLHAWPEYYSFEKEIWIPIDPTWGNTTGGVDFFDKLDLRHFTFVIHASDPENPPPPGSYKLGPNPQKDVFVTFGKLPDKKTPTLALSSKNKPALSLTKKVVEVNVANTGMVAAYNLKPTVYFDDQKIPQEDIVKLLPFTEVSFTILVPISFLGINTPSNIRVEVGEEELEISGFKTKVLLDSFVFLLIILMLGVSILIIFLNRSKLKTLKARFYAKHFRQKTPKNQKN